ncbi:MAG: hypothetical protein DI536_34625, partial [Archangium gephyra]
ILNFDPKAAAKVNFKNEDRAPLLFIAGEKGWEEVASFALDWANSRRRSASTDSRRSSRKRRARPPSTSAGSA